VILHTIQKTTLPDQERQARVAKALSTDARTPSIEPDSALGTEVHAATTRQARANRMLLRAARSAVGRSGFADTT